MTLSKIELVESSGVIKKRISGEDAGLNVQVKISYRENRDDTFQVKLDLDVNSPQPGRPRTKKQGLLKAAVTISYVAKADGADIDSCVSQLWPYLRGSAITQTRLIGLGQIADSLPLTPTPVGE